MTIDNAGDNAGQLGFSSDRLQRITGWMQRYVDEGKLAGASALVARRGRIAYRQCVGFRDLAHGRRFEDDTIVRIYSMTKPITSVALMMLVEQARVRLDDAVADYLPDLANMPVLVPGARSLDEVEPCTTAMTVHHLLTHRSGLTYGFDEDILSKAYEARKLWFRPGGGGNAAMVRKIGELPLLFQPGTRWHYSVATDIVGRLIEVVSGKSLDVYFKENIFEPLGMTDTDFRVSTEKLDRFASLYMVSDEDRLKCTDTPATTAFTHDKVDTLSGGGGLVSCMDDYFRFAEMMRCGGKFGSGTQSIRLLGSRTLAHMTRNHLPGEIAAMGPKTFSEMSFEGVGFGLSGWVMLDPARAQMMGSPGDFGWGGLANTVFIVDPAEELTFMFMTQLIPSNQYPLRKELRALVYSSLVD